MRTPSTMPLPSGLCLVTGATGFVAAAVARILLKAGHRVRVLARPDSDRSNLAGLAVEVTQGSLEDAPSLAAAVAGCRYLFHVAADYRLWVPDPVAMFRVNVGGTRELMLAALAAGVERIVYTSSVATLGIVSGGVADEETLSTAEDMIGPYKRSKFDAGAEALARLTGREPFATVDGVRMSRKKMFFSSARAMRELGYAPRPARQAIADAVAWFKANGYLQ